MQFDLTLIILAPVAAGLFASTSPCVLPLYPGFLAYVASSEEALKRGWVTGSLVLAGVVTMMLGLGVLIASLSVATGSILQWILPTAAAAIAILGVLLLFDISVFAKLPQLQVPGVSNPYANAYTYGLLYGPIAFPCSAAFAISVFALSVSTADFVLSVLAFLMFGLGLGIPLLALALLGQGLQRRISSFFAQHYTGFNRAAGALLVGMAGFIFWENWESMALAFGLA